MRTIARTTQALSHDTVHRVLTEPRAPAWGPLELVVEALDGLAANGESGNAAVEARVREAVGGLTRRFPIY